MKKTIKDFLDSLPEPAKTRAYNNLHKKADLTELVENMEIAFARSFKFKDYDESPEGFKYWYDIFTETDREYHQKKRDYLSDEEIVKFKDCLEDMRKLIEKIDAIRNGNINYATCHNGLYMDKCSRCLLQALEFTCFER